MLQLRSVNIGLSSLITGITLAALTTTRVPYENPLQLLDMHIDDVHHDLQKPLHPSYIDNLKIVGVGSILLVHDNQGNIDESTYHYMGLKIHEIYEILSSFLTNHDLKKASGEMAAEDMLYLTHRNLMRYSLSYLTLELYMTLLYKSRQEALERLDKHYPSNTKREIIERQCVRNNFDQQFTSLMAKARTLMSQQMVYSEKTFYWNSKLTEEEEYALSGSDISCLLRVQDHQNSMSEGLNEFEKLLKAKRKFYVEHIIPEELAEQERNKQGVNE